MGSIKADELSKKASNNSAKKLEQKKLFISRYVSIIFCKGEPCSSHVENYKFMVWKRKELPYHWDIPKQPIDCSEKDTDQAAMAMLENYYSMSPNAVTLPKDRYIVLYNVLNKIIEANFYIVNLLRSDITIRVPEKFSGFNFMTARQAEAVLQYRNLGEVVRYYETCVLPEMHETLSVVAGNAQKCRAFSATTEHKRMLRGIASKVSSIRSNKHCCTGDCASFVSKAEKSSLVQEKTSDRTISQSIVSFRRPILAQVHTIMRLNKLKRRYPSWIKKYSAVRQSSSNISKLV